MEADPKACILAPKPVLSRIPRAIASITACATISCTALTPKTPVAKLAEKYMVTTGVLVAPAELKNGKHRLVVYFNEQAEAIDEEHSDLLRDANGEMAKDLDGSIVLAPKVPMAAKKNVLMCIASNDSNSQVLVNLREYLNDPKAQGKTIFIYGKPITGAWQEYLGGVYCYITAIGFYVPATGSYTYVMTEYGDGVFDNFSWTEFLKKLGSAAAKKAF